MHMGVSRNLQDGSILHFLHYLVEIIITASLSNKNNELNFPTK